GRKNLPVWRKRQGVDAPFMPAKLTDQFLRGQIAQFDCREWLLLLFGWGDCDRRALTSPQGRHASISRAGKRTNRGLAAIQRGEFLSRLGAPETKMSAVPNDKHPPAPDKGQANHRIESTIQLANELTRCSAPQTDPETGFVHGKEFAVLGG